MDKKVFRDNSDVKPVITGEDLNKALDDLKAGKKLVLNFDDKEQLARTKRVEQNIKAQRQAEDDLFKQEKTGKPAKHHGFELKN